MQAISILIFVWPFWTSKCNLRINLKFHIQSYCNFYNPVTASRTVWGGLYMAFDPKWTALIAIMLKTTLYTIVLTKGMPVPLYTRPCIADIFYGSIKFNWDVLNFSHRSDCEYFSFPTCIIHVESTVMICYLFHLYSITFFFYHNFVQSYMANSCVHLFTKIFYF